MYWNFEQVNLDRNFVMIPFDDFDMTQLVVASFVCYRTKIQHYTVDLKR